MTIPQDPFMLLSYVNTLLRDYYSSLGEMCDDLGMEREQLEEKLKAIGYYYMEEINQFR